MKDMKEDKNFNFKATKESLNKLKDISKNMSGKTFHFYTHILFDIRTALGNSKKTYLEIGSFAGASISLVSSHPYLTNCYSLDLGNPIPQNIVELNVNKFKNENSTFKYFKGDSKDIILLEKIKNEVGEIDMLFIDGDHSYNGVINDFNNYSSLVTNGGYIIFDDYNDYKHSPEVKPAVNYIISQISEAYEILGTSKAEFNVGDLDGVGGNCFIVKKK
jgi:hypothetical protein